MALKWFNIRTGETIVTDTEPQISAFWASSDHSPNITQGQDFGWRLAPEINVELKKIKQDFGMLAHIAQRFSKTVEDLGESDILTYISNKTALEQAPQAQVSDYQDEYDAQVRALEQAGRKPVTFDTEEQVTTTTTTKSLEALRAELAAREAAEAPAPTTTTTTTEAPTTTTTTTVLE